MELSLTESQLTEIIKEAMAHYKNKPFGRAIFTQKHNGVEVTFCDAGAEEDIPVYRHEEPRQREEEEPAPSFQLPNFITNPDGGGGFGGFGGGKSGGGGASGQW